MWSFLHRDELSFAGFFFVSDKFMFFKLETLNLVSILILIFILYGFIGLGLGVEFPFWGLINFYLSISSYLPASTIFLKPKIINDHLVFLPIII